MAQRATSRTTLRPPSPRQDRHDGRRYIAFALVILITVASGFVMASCASSDSPSSTPWSSTGERAPQADLARTVQSPANTIATASGNTSASTFRPLDHCQEKWFTQTFDHFDVGAPAYQQRYFVCDEFYRPDDGVMFFYVGNEGDVELYLNHTGLMWENAREFGALLVFAEHRYFGQSKPFGADNSSEHLQFLSTAQALADYAVLITHLKAKVLHHRNLPVVGFGGSYGGMLGSWFRMKYPHIIDGVIAASAPVLLFHGDPHAPPKMEAYAQIITYDASPAAGSAANCVPNARQAWKAVRALGATTDSRERLKRAMNLCEDTAVDLKEDVESVMSWAKGAFEMMSMGNYPYPSAYVSSDPSALLPAYPMRAACSFLAGEFSTSDAGQLELVAALARGVGVYHNSSGSIQCFSVSTPSSARKTPSSMPRDINYWAYLSCAELYGPVTMDGELDMFWAAPWDFEADNKMCERQFGVPIALTWAATEYGGLRALQAASNIVFSNGEYDPCGGLGVLESVSESVVAVRIEGGAHHLDLMFSHPLDPPSVKEAREIEMKHMTKWIDQARSS